MSRKKSQPETTRVDRPPDDDEADELTIEECERIPGFEKLATPKNRANWKHRGHVPWGKIGPLLLEWFNDERGKIPPPDPFAEYDGALVRGLKLMIEYYTLTPNPRAFDHWVATIGGFRNGIARAARQEAHADKLDPIRELLDGTAADAEIQDETA